MAISQFDNVNSYLKSNVFAWTNTLVRANAFPIEKWSVFGSIEQVSAYVNESTDVEGMGDATSMPYDGQIVAVKNAAGTQDVYVIDHTALSTETCPAGLRKLASGGSADEIQAYLNSEIARAKAAEIALSAAVSGEVSARTKADGELQTAVNSLSTELKGDITDLSVELSNAISAENKRAVAAEAQTLADAKAYTDEKAQALSAALSTAWHFVGVKPEVPADALSANYNDGDVIIVNKGSAAIEYAFYQGKWQQLGDESSNVSQNMLDTAIAGLSATVSAEIDADVYALSNELYGKIDQITGDLDAEEQARIANDGYLSGKIDTVSSDVKNEAATRKSNDDYLSGAIDAEEAARIANDNYLSGQIDVISGDLKKEAAKRAADDEYLSGQIEALSANLSAEIEVLSAKLSGEIDAVKNAANGDLGTVSAALSNDYVEKIGNLSTSISTTVDAEIEELDGKIDALDQKVDQISSDLSDEIVALSGELTGLIDAEAQARKNADDELSNAIKALSGDYVTEAEFNTSAVNAGFDRASAADKLTISSDVTAAITKAVEDLDYGPVTATTVQTIKSVSQVDGKISVEVQDIDFSALDNYVLTSVAEEATTTDKLVKETTVDAKIADAISAISADELPVAADETISTIKQENGKITFGTQSIQIAQSQVTGLTTDLNKITSDIDDLSTGLSDYVKYTDVAGTPKADDKIVLSSQVKSAIDEAVEEIGSVLHFKGVLTCEVADWVADDETQKGDVYLAGDAKEYVVVEKDGGFELREIGDEKIIDQYVTKTTKINDHELTADVTLDGTDLKVGGEGDYKAETVANAISAIDGRLDTLETEMDAAQADITAISANYLTVAAANTLSNELDGKIDTLSGELDDKIEALSGIALSGVTVNDVSAEIVDNVAKIELSASQLLWDIVEIDCGAAV